MTRPSGDAIKNCVDSSAVNPLIEWLLNEGWSAADSATLIDGLALQLVAQGIPLSRLLVFIHSLRPHTAGILYTWSRDRGCVESVSEPHALVKNSIFQSSPVVANTGDTGAAIRRRLDISDPCLGSPILKDFLAAGMTDCIAVPMQFSSGEASEIILAVDTAGGFTDAQLGGIRELARVLARLLEIHAVRHEAKTLLDTYLGKHTGERVLQGLVRRGDGEDIHAVIWFCDLRDSTALADSMPRKEFLGLLNDFFDCMAGAVLDHGGEVLRFIGDATLAIFATGTSSHGVKRGCCDSETACHTALAAAKDARARMAALNCKRMHNGESPLRFGLALHMGEVTYGNIGVPGRLEFTVIGAAANEAARLEGLCKTLNQPLLISSAFKGCFPGELVSLGFHSLRGVSAPEEIFGLPEEETSTQVLDTF